ncbi:hypothetical protein MJO28_013616 [Puccinia striiformis f. sp. tritici]|uniref:Uncharacterized protein n=1 Tax=Puccinia striiformis f. sp. tritici TaxID=168172 RepID=A0ACC0DUV0_9BASI|nr:hypothetical protein MJO28_013616 [Puccinia striiformis f. sp. tritici]
MLLGMLKCTAHLKSWDFCPTQLHLDANHPLHSAQQTPVKQSPTYTCNLSNQSPVQYKVVYRSIELYQQTQCVTRDPNTCKRCGRPAILLASNCKFMVQLVCLEPGLFLEEMRERLYNSTGTQLSYQAVHDNLVNRLSITLKKPSTGNCQKNLVANPFCDRDMLRSHAWAEHGASATQLIVNQNAERLSLLPAISIKGLVALTITIDTFQGPKFKHCLEFDLASLHRKDLGTLQLTLLLAAPSY